MRLLVTALAYVATLAVVAVATFFGVLFLAGPHGGVLPNAAQPYVLILGWATVIVLPILAARFTWRFMAGRFGARMPPREKEAE